MLLGSVHHTRAVRGWKIAERIKAVELLGLGPRGKQGSRGWREEDEDDTSGSGAGESGSSGSDGEGLTAELLLPPPVAATDR
ncbi:hypothetical protein GCM10007147_22750 [Nocardiopsis kunsanensis]|uniref:Uncharacterized protein n=1 Tax=Nocardiopsis kunsanensis TaxID=141693 RepID=A0A918XDA6_9ACTN|nr:hypothetical protein GCM10007147_22750 [Nocardiopsis kunsanensis]